MVSFTAPTVPGVYSLVVVDDYQYTAAAAVARFPSQTRRVILTSFTVVP